MTKSYEDEMRFKKTQEGLSRGMSSVITKNVEIKLHTSFKTGDELYQFWEVPFG